MTTLLESLSWWPWSSDAGPIRNVQHAREAPGMVTLKWRTDAAVPTALFRRDGTRLFGLDDPKLDHQVTLTGWAGRREDIVIRAGADEQLIQVAF